MLRNVTAIDQGAKGIRPVGRLAFFWNFRKIHRVLQNARQRTEGHEQKLLQDQGLIVDPGLNIFVAGSLCGGTGSGMFLDMAYSLRNTYEDVKVIGYFIISPELYGNHPRMCANTYSALMELDYYSRKGTQFEACFDQQDLRISREKRPPFDSIYLVSNRTENNEYSIHDQGKLCNVIAYKIALDFVSELAPQSKSNRDNFDPLMMSMDKHPRPNCQHYLTFGMSAIYFPRERISKLVTNYIKSQLLTFWLEGIGQSSDPQRLLELFLVESQWQMGSNQKDGILQKLESTPLEGDKNFNQLMNGWRNKQTGSIDRCKNRDSRNQTKQLLLRSLRDQFRKSILGDTEATRGSWLTTLQRNRDEVTKQLCLDIDHFLSRILTANDINFSIINARNWIDALQTEIDRYQQDFQSRYQRLAPQGLDDLDKKWKQFSQLVNDHENEFRLFGLGRNRSIQDACRQTLETTAKATKDNFDLAVASEGLKVARDLQLYVQQRSSNLTALNNLVSNLRRAYERDQEALEQLNLDEMSGQPIYDKNDVAVYCEILLPESDRREQLVQITQQVQKQGARSETLVEFMSSNQVAAEQVRQDIDAVLDQYFGLRTDNTVKSVIKRFNQSYPPAARSAALTQVLREAQPLIPLRKDFYFDDNPAKRSTLIGFKDSDDQEVQQFKSVLLQDNNVDENMLYPIQSEDQILFVTEYAAFPLRFINNLDKFRMQYIKAMSSSNSFLHNDRRISFTDIVPPPVDLMQSMEETFYPCLALGILKENSNDNVLEFSYRDLALDEIEVIPLSNDWTSALEVLVNRHDLKVCLEDQLNSKLDEISHNPGIWKGEKGYRRQIQKKISAIRKLNKDDINFDHVVKVAGTIATSDTTAQKGILGGFIEKVENLILSSESNRSLPSSQVETPEIQDAEFTDN